MTEWPAVWIKAADENGNAITELEYGLLCESFNSGSHMDIENTISMDLAIVENFLLEPSLYFKKFKSKLDWNAVQKAKMEAMQQNPLQP